MSENKLFIGGRSHGKRYAQYCEFVESVKRDELPFIVSPDYVVVSNKHWMDSVKELQSLKAEIERLRNGIEGLKEPLVDPGYMVNDYTSGRNEQRTQTNAKIDALLKEER